MQQIDPFYDFIASWHWLIVAIIKLTLAAFLGAIIGLERQYRGRGAGLRTHLLVSLGASLVMVVSLYFGSAYEHVSVESCIRIDPARLAYGIMTGIGFLGAGAIIQSRKTIRGLTTGASLWCAAAVGISCGFGLIIISLFVTFLVLFALIILDRFEDYIPTELVKTIKITFVTDPEESFAKIHEEFQKLSITLKTVDFKHQVHDSVYEITLNVKTPPSVTIWQIRQIFADIDHASSIEIH